ncbi:MAG: PAS domain-containing protein, partial [Deltaproteobacteria bacterium]|nr:PAS domain-containing protein [Deltaproteobacteria bacterium]
MKKNKQLFGSAELGQIAEILQSKRIIATIVATLAVVVMLILLTITINHSREQKVVNLFLAEQKKLNRSLSLATKSILQQTENGLKTLAMHLPVEGKKREAAMRNFYEANGELIETIALVDQSGKIVICIAEDPRAAQEGVIHKANRAFTPVDGDVFLSLLAPLNDGSRMVAVVSLRNLLTHLLPRRVTEISSQILLAGPEGDVWLCVPESPGRIFSSESVKAIIASHLHPLDHELIENNPHLFYQENEQAKRAIASTRRLAEEEKYPFIIVAAELNTIIGAVRNAFLNNMAGVAFLITIVIFAAAVVIYNIFHNLVLQQEIETLKISKRWEEKLSHKQKIIEGIIAGSPIASFVIDKEHKIILWNAACEQLTGFRREEMLNTSRQYEPFYGAIQARPVIADIIVDNDSEALRNFYGKTAVRPSKVVINAYEATGFFANLNGKDRHLFFLAAPIYDEDGQIIVAIETLQDITAIVEANKQLTEYAESLESEIAVNVSTRREMEGLYNYLRSIMNSLPDTLLDVNEDGTINNIVRHDRGDAWGESHKGKPISELVDRNTREFLVSKWEEVKQGKINSFELETTSPKFPTKNYFITCSPVSGTNRYVVIRRDVTDIKSLEKKFYESQKLAMMGHLATGIAHEIRNPLSSIKMSLQIIKKRLSLEGNDLKRLDIALTEVGHLESLVTDILVYAKPAEPKKRPSNINNIINDALVLQESIISEKNIVVEKKLSPSLPLIPLDEGMLTQVFINIYRNAVEAMADGGLLSITTAPTNNHGIKIVIADNGKGIEATYIANIFDPFFTADKPAGTGLGLTQVKRLVELHGGEIQITSAVGIGTTVVISIPT